MEEKAPKGLPNKSLETDSVRHQLICLLHIYLWGLSWKMREWLARPLALGLLFVARFELFAGPGYHLGLPLPESVRRVFDPLLGIAAVLMFLEHHLQTNALRRYEMLLENVNDLLGSFEGDTADWDKAVALSMQRVLIAINPVMKSELFKTERFTSLLSKEEINCVILRQVGDSLVTVLCEPPGNSHFSQLKLDLKNACCGYSARHRVITLVPSVKHRHGIRLDRSWDSGKQHKNWILSILTEGYDIEKSAPFKSLLCAPIIRTNGDLYGVLLVCSTKKDAFRKFHFDAIHLATNFVTQAVEGDEAHRRG